jgi:hypothetical protein
MNNKEASDDASAFQKVFIPSMPCIPQKKTALKKARREWVK